MNVRHSSLLLSFSLVLLIAVPWVAVSTQWSLYLLALATLALAVIFRLSND